MYQNLDLEGQGNLVKQEIDENPASVTSSTSGMSASGQNEETVIPQRDHEDDQNLVGQTVASTDETLLNQAALQKAIIQAVGVKTMNGVTTSLIPSSYFMKLYIRPYYIGYILHVYYIVL